MPYNSHLCVLCEVRAEYWCFASPNVSLCWFCSISHPWVTDLKLLVILLNLDCSNEMLLPHSTTECVHCERLESLRTSYTRGVEVAK